MLTFNDCKAGMSGLDKEKITRIIEENTNQKFGAFAKKKNERIAKQQEDIREKIRKLNEYDHKSSLTEMTSLMDELEMERDLSRNCVHIDMDAFFASVEMRDDRRLRNVPMAVGSESMLSTSNYIARQFGVRAAMPGFIARKLCPELVIVPGNYEKYSEESRVFAAIFSEYDEEASMGSLDEAYLDITEYMKTRTPSVTLKRIRYSGDCVCRLPRISPEECCTSSSSPISEKICLKCKKSSAAYQDTVTFGCTREEVVEEIRFRVEQATGLTCSAGLAANFMLAKICSDVNKPNGQFSLRNSVEDIRCFLENLPIRKVSGIGRVSESLLQAANIHHCGDIVRQRRLLPHIFTKFAVDSFLRIGLGLGSSHSSRSSDVSRKSISMERTFAATSDFAQITAHLRSIAAELAAQLPHSRIHSARSLTVKMKMASFDQLTRCAKIPTGVSLRDEESIYRYAKAVAINHEGQCMRLIGIRLHRLVFEEEEEKAARSSVAELLMKRGAGERESSEDAPTNQYHSTSSSESIPIKNYNYTRTVGSSEDVSPSDVPSQALEKLEWSCPVCFLPFDGGSWSEVNGHIDECLNRELIRESLGEQPTPPMAKRNRELIRESTGEQPTQPRAKKARSGSIRDFCIRI